MSYGCWPCSDLRSTLVQVFKDDLDVHITRKPHTVQSEFRLGSSMLSDVLRHLTVFARLEFIEPSIKTFDTIKPSFFQMMRRRTIDSECHLIPDSRRTAVGPMSVLHQGLHGLDSLCNFFFVTVQRHL